MTDKMLKGIIDMHVHTDPDLRPRVYDDLSLADKALSIGARAIVIKSHLGSTAARAWVCNRYLERAHGFGSDRPAPFTMYGGIVLNRQAGGLDPWAVEACLKLGGKVVWLPTQSSRNHLRMMHQAEGASVDVIRDGRPLPELLDIFRLIKDHDAVMATAHISPEEAFIVTEAARAHGIQKIVITHPEWWLVGMSLDDQLRLVKDYGVILEHCFAQPMGGGIYKSNLPMNLEAIQACGYKNVMISTDSGQLENPPWEEGLSQYIAYLREHGIPDEELYHMTHTIQEDLLGLPPLPSSEIHDILSV